jgi:hypothetical protein
MSRPSPDRPRILFLDDDPTRAARFAAQRESAVWVQTAGQCLDRLERESWDEVHLDHDLGGEHFVDPDREDCGMAVVRWLCGAPRAHLQGTRFVIHTHNPIAAQVMVFHLQIMGFEVQVCPFGSDRGGDALDPQGHWWTLVQDLRDWLRRLAGG